LSHEDSHVRCIAQIVNDIGIAVVHTALLLDWARPAVPFAEPLVLAIKRAVAAD